MIQELASNRLASLSVDSRARLVPHRLFANGSESAPINVYSESVGTTRDMVRTGDSTQPGDPARVAAAILTVLAADRTPLRLPLGGDALDAIAAHLDSARTDLGTWEDLSRSTAFSEHPGLQLPA